MKDTLEAVRPKLKMFLGFEEACKACEDLENEFKPKIGNPVIETVIRLKFSLRFKIDKGCVLPQF